MVWFDDIEHSDSEYSDSSKEYTHVVNSGPGYQGDIPSFEMSAQPLQVFKEQTYETPLQGAIYNVPVYSVSRIPKHPTLNEETRSFDRKDDIRNKLKMRVN